jgi:hypothetical protein
MGTDGQTNQRMNQPTDGPTNQRSYRGACSRLKSYSKDYSKDSKFIDNQAVLDVITCNAITDQMKQEKSQVKITF